MGHHQGDATVGLTKPVYIRAKSVDYQGQHQELSSSRYRMEELFAKKKRQEIVEEDKDGDQLNIHIKLDTAIPLLPPRVSYKRSYSL